MKIDWVKLKKKLFENIFKVIGALIAVVALILYMCSVDTDIIVTVLAVGGVIIMIDMKLNQNR